MGMQVHFDKEDLPEGSQVEYIHDSSSNTWSADIVTINGDYIPANCVKNKDSSFWFDCGRASIDQMALIKKLILNRIPFNVS